MNIQTLTSVDAFVAVDLPEAAVATGQVRCARKILRDGAENLARATTYQYAAFRIPVSGASAGINAEGEARDPAVAGFVAELAPQVADGSMRLRPAKGVTAADLADWQSGVAAAEADPGALDEHDLIAAGVLASATAAHGDLTGASVGIELGAPGAAQIEAGATAAGARVTLGTIEELSAEPRDVVIVGSKVGVLHHENVAALCPSIIVGAAPLSITAKGLAVARRGGGVVLADFVTSAGPTLAGAPLPPADGEPLTEAESVAAAIAAVVNTTLDHPDGPFLAACYAAEEFLDTWVQQRPFGRPLP